MSSVPSSPQQAEDIYEFSINLKRQFRVVQWLILGLFTLSLGGGLMISSIKAKHGMIVYSDGRDTWLLDQEVALRISSFDLFLRNALELKSAELTLVGPQGKRYLQLELSPALEDLWQVTFRAPQEAGEYTLSIVASAQEPKPKRTGEHRQVVTFKAERTIKVIQGL